MKSWLVLCGLVWLAVAPLALAQQDLTREQVAAYVALTRGDRARQRNEPLVALAAYQEALAKYKQIRERDPRWHPDVVGYRIQYCEQELAKLARPEPVEPAAPPPAVAPAAVAVVAEPVPETAAPSDGRASPAGPEAKEIELQALRRQVAELQAALSVTQVLAEVEQDRVALAAERDELRERVAALEQAPLAPAPDEGLTRKLEEAGREQERLRVEADGWRKRVDELTADRDERAAAVTDLEAKLAALREEQGRAAQRATDLEVALAQVTAERDELRRPQPAAELESLRGELGKARQALEDCTRQTETRLKAYAAAQRERDELAPQVKEARQQMKEMQATLKVLKEKEAGLASAHQQELGVLRKEVARLKAGVPTPSDMEQALTEQVDSLTRQLRAVREEATAREQRLQELQQENERLQSGG